MNITQWLEDHSSEITLFGKTESVVRTEDLKEYMNSIVEELKQNLYTAPEVSKSTCEVFKLEYGMFAYLPNGTLTQEILESLRDSNYKLETFLREHGSGSYTDWSCLCYDGKRIFVKDGHDLISEISFELFMQAVRNGV